MTRKGNGCLANRQSFYQHHTGSARGQPCADSFSLFFSFFFQQKLKPFPFSGKMGMMTGEEYVAQRLDALADKSFQANSKGFKDKEHFRFCLGECYALIANGTCRKLEDVQDPKFEMDYDEFAASGADGRVDFDGFCNIPSDDFEHLFELVKYDDGKRKRVPHSVLLKLLAEDNIIAINPFYQKGVFSKSYLLHWDFISKVWEECR